MKKILKLAVIVLMIVTSLTVTACSKNNPSENSEYESSLALFNKIWSTYKASEKFSAIGGDSKNAKDDAPGKFNLSNKDDLKYVILLTDNLIGMVDDGASLQHMMNTNTFCSAIFRLKDGKDASTFAEEYKEAVLNNRWMCGFPDTVIVISLDNYVILAYGDAELIETFKTKCLSISEDAALLVEAAI